MAFMIKTLDFILSDWKPLEGFEHGKDILCHILIKVILGTLGELTVERDKSEMWTTKWEATAPNLGERSWWLELSVKVMR